MDIIGAAAGALLEMLTLKRKKVSLNVLNLLIYKRRTSLKSDL